MEKPTLLQRIDSACLISSLGAKNVGVKTKQTFSYPYTDVADYVLDKEAAHLLYKIIGRLFLQMPLQEFELIEQEIDERLSFAV